MLIESNIDALVGPTHHFGGLGMGNVASLAHAHQISNPREAALEGLRKASLVAGLGLPQFVWLPPMRPRFDLLGNLGYCLQDAAPGQLQQVLEQVRHESPRALSAAFSSAFMWAANAGTFSPAADAADGQNHFTPANLISSWHRAFEAEERTADFGSFCGPQSRCILHDPLAAIFPLRDEGAANHMRLCDTTGDIGFNVFVYGEQEGRSSDSAHFPRHARAASEAIARRHHLPSERTFLLRQHPAAISAGVFHNDVIATSHQHVLIHHEQAFLEGEDELDRLERTFVEHTRQRLSRITVTSRDLSLEDAVSSYFFNSQIVSPSQAAQRDRPRMILISPSQCRDMPAAKQLVDRLLSDSAVPIEDVYYVELGQSMANGGGPACLRLRIPLDEVTLENISSDLRVNASTLDRLNALIVRYYPTSVSLDDFVNVDFVEHVQQTAAEIKRVMLESNSGP